MKKLKGWVVTVKDSVRISGYDAPHGLGERDPDKRFHLVFYSDQTTATTAATSMHETDKQDYSVHPITIEFN